MKQRTLRWRTQATDTLSIEILKSGFHGWSDPDDLLIRVGAEDRDPKLIPYKQVGTPNR